MATIGHYTDAGFHMEPLRLSREVYEQAIRSIVFVCTDILITDIERTRVYCPWRISRPLSNCWWKIGGRVVAGEELQVAAHNRFKRETMLNVPVREFRELPVVQVFRFADRAQEPTNAGSHNVAFNYAVALSPEQICFIEDHLDPHEFDRARGLRGFTIEELELENVHPSLLAAAKAALS